MGSHSVFPFLGLPAELRLEIYKHAWTVSKADHVYRAEFPYGDSELRLTISYLKAQLSAIRTLGAISQRIRAEAYPEYFDHTQILLCYESAWERESFMFLRYRSGRDKHNRSAMYILGGSHLLQTQARHVKLHWPVHNYSRLQEVLDEDRARARYQEELLNEQWAVEFVSCFKNLRSLELDHPDPDSSYNHKKELKRMFYDDERRAKLIEGLKTHHRKLENAIVRTDISDPKTNKVLNEHESFGWWRQLKKDVAALASQSLSSVEGKMEDIYVIKQHIGGSYWWPDR